MFDGRVCWSVAPHHIKLSFLTILRRSDLPGLTRGLCCEPSIPVPFAIEIQDQGHLRYKPDAGPRHEYDAW